MPALVETMFYQGEVPWHRLGTKVDHALTSEEAIIEAGLDWDVELVSVAVNKRVVPEFKAIRRATDKKLYNIVRNRYTPIQNREAFSFFDNVVGEKVAMFHTAGSLRDGAQIWMLAKLPDSFSIKGEEIQKYICLTNSHDGTSAMKMFWTPVRVVCSNTLAMAEGKAATKFYTRHTQGYKNKFEIARDILGISNNYYQHWIEEAEHLANHPINSEGLEVMLRTAFGYKVTVEEKDIYKPIIAQMNKVKELMEVGRGMDNTIIRGTKWQAYNALVEFVDYYKPTRSKKEESILSSAWFGYGAVMKNRAWNHLLKV